jgi:hypothetical protein
VLFLFLFNLRTAFISTIAIPLSLLAAVIILRRYGVNLNIMVLGGLAIALGEVVDDAIIDTENIFRRLRENRALPAPRPIGEVVYEASMEVRGSVGCSRRSAPPTSSPSSPRWLRRSPSPRRCATSCSATRACTARTRRSYAG